MFQKISLQGVNKRSENFSVFSKEQRFLNFEGLSHYASESENVVNELMPKQKEHLKNLQNTTKEGVLTQDHINAFREKVFKEQEDKLKADPKFFNNSENAKDFQKIHDILDKDLKKEELINHKFIQIGAIIFKALERIKNPKENIDKPQELLAMSKMDYLSYLKNTLTKDSSINNLKRDEILNILKNKLKENISESEFLNIGLDIFIDNSLKDKKQIILSYLNNHNKFNQRLFMYLIDKNLYQNLKGKEKIYLEKIDTLFLEKLDIDPQDAQPLEKQLGVTKDQIIKKDGKIDFKKYKEFLISFENVLTNSKTKNKDLAIIQYLKEFNITEKSSEQDKKTLLLAIEKVFNHKNLYSISGSFETKGHSIATVFREAGVDENFKGVSSAEVFKNLNNEQRLNFVSEKIKSISDSVEPLEEDSKTFLEKVWEMISNFDLGKLMSLFFGNEKSAHLQDVEKAKAEDMPELIIGIEEELADNANLDPNKRLMLLKTKDEYLYQLERKGYNRLEKQGKEVIQLDQDTSLQDLCSNPKIKSQSEQQMSGLVLATKFKKGERVYVSADGYIVGHGTEKQNPNQVKKEIFVKPEAGVQEKPDNQENRLNFMKSKLKAGDMILMTGQTKDMFSKVGRTGIRESQKGFMFTHIVTYTGNNEIFNMNAQQGGHKTTVDKLMKHSTLTNGDYVILRNPELTADEAQKFINELVMDNTGKPYDKAALVSLGVQDESIKEVIDMAMNNKNLSKAKFATVCTGVIQKALADIGEGTLDNKTANLLTFFKQMKRVQVGRIPKS